MTERTTVVECQHSYKYMGLVYFCAAQPEGHRWPRLYQDKFFCSKCLAMEYRNTRQHGSTELPPIDGSLPK